MQVKTLAAYLAASGVGAFVTAAFFLAAPARSAEPPKAAAQAAPVVPAVPAVDAGEQNAVAKPAAKSDMPAGYVVVNEAFLRQVVREEVTRQMEDHFAQGRREQQTRDAGYRVPAITNLAMTLRSQIALYRLQHNDEIPNVNQVGDGFSFLMLRTDVTGRPSTGPDAFGPYMQAAAANPITGRTKVVEPGRATPDAGWTYNSQTGAVKAVLPRQLQSKLKDKLNARDVEFVDAN